MRWRHLLSVTLFAIVGCSEPQPYPQGPQTPYGAGANPNALPPHWAVPVTPSVDLATSSRECTLLIGSINAGLAHVTATGLKAGEEGKDTFAETAAALDAVGRAIEEQVYVTPDLLRLGGFFIGIVRNQSLILGQVAATPDGDTARLTALQNQLAVLYEQEDRLIAELNLLCRGEASPSEPAAPSASPPPTPAPAPALPPVPSASPPAPSP